MTEVQVSEIEVVDEEAEEKEAGAERMTGVEESRYVVRIL